MWKKSSKNLRIYLLVTNVLLTWCTIGLIKADLTLVPCWNTSSYCFWRSDFLNSKRYFWVFFTPLLGVLPWDRGHLSNPFNDTDNYPLLPYKSAGSCPRR